jgi:hypothetical protein
MAKKKNPPAVPNAAWKINIDNRVASGQQLGLSYLQGLASQYGVPYSQITGYIGKKGYTLGEKAAAAAAQPAAPAFNPGQYDSLKIKDAGALENYLKTQLNPADIKSWQPGVTEKNVPGLDMLADYMGVKNINSQKEIKQALNILGGMESPLPAAKASSAGITNYNSVNDYLKVLGGGVGAPAATAAAPAPVATPVQTLTTPTAPTKSMTAAEAILAGVDEMLAQMQDQDAMAAMATQQQAELQRQASRTLAANMARAGMMPNLQIQPATGVSPTAGTHTLQTILSGLNSGLGSFGSQGTLPVTLNI